MANLHITLQIAAILVPFFFKSLCEWGKKKGGEPVVHLLFPVVALPGLEPGNAAPKTVVLPLHYKAIPMSLRRHAAKNAVQNYCFFLIRNLFNAIFCYCHSCKPSHGVSLSAQDDLRVLSLLFFVVVKRVSNIFRVGL